MSRGYSRRGGGLSIIFAIVGTLIVVIVGIFIYNKVTGSSALDTNSAAPTPTLAASTVPTATPVPSPTLISIITATPTPTPSDTGTGLLDSTAEPTATQTPIPNYESATVAVSSLRVRQSPSSSSSQIGSVKYGATYEVYDVDGKWLKINYSGSYGWIYGGTSGGVPCVVRGDDALPPCPTPQPDPTMLKSASLSGTTLTVKFTCEVYSKSDATGALEASDFSVKEGSTTITIVSVTHTAGSDTVTIGIGTTSGGALTVSIEDDTVYNADGEDSTAGSVTTGTSTDNTAPTFSMSISGTTITITFSENVYSNNDGTGDLEDSDYSITVPGGVTWASSHTAGTKTATIELTGTTGGESITVVVKSNSAFDSAGNVASQAGDTLTVP